MEVYVGLDVSLKETAICVVDGSGKIVSEGKVLSEPLALAEFLRAKAGSAKRIGLETGPTTQQKTLAVDVLSDRKRWAREGAPGPGGGHQAYASSRSNFFHGSCKSGYRATRPVCAYEGTSAAPTGTSEPCQYATSAR